MPADAPPAIAFALALTLAACGGAVDDTTLGWVEHLDAARAAAVVAPRGPDADRAHAALDAVIARAPTASRRPAAVRALVDDARFVLGRLDFDAGRHAAALDQAERALTGRPADAPDTPFAANLHALRALALEALGRPGDAIAAWEAAQLIHQRLFERALAAGAPDEVPP